MSHQARSAAPPKASWVLGRSARWQTPEGSALLAEGPRADLAPALIMVLTGGGHSRSIRGLCRLWEVVSRIRAAEREGEFG